MGREGEREREREREREEWLHDISWLVVTEN